MSASGTSVGRHLATKVDLTDIAYLEQLETRSDPGRDPRGRVLATAYLALVSADVEPRIPADTAWHPVQDLPPTAFDHGSIAESGRDRLRAKLSYTNIGFALAPETFTIAQLRDIYAASVGHPVSATNLQRVLTRRGVIEATPAAARPTSAGRQAGHALPVRGPDPDRHQSLRRIPSPVPAADGGSVEAVTGLRSGWSSQTRRQRVRRRDQRGRTGRCPGGGSVIVGDRGALDGCSTTWGGVPSARLSG